MNLYAVNICPFKCSRELDDRTLRNQIKTTHALVAYNERREVNERIDITLKEWACHGASSCENNRAWVRLFYICLLSEYQYRFDMPHKLFIGHNVKISKSVIYKGQGRILLYHNPKYKNLDHSDHYPTEEAYQYLLRSRYLHYKPKWTKRVKPEWVNINDVPKLTMRFIDKYNVSDGGTFPCTRCGEKVKVKVGKGFFNYSFKCSTKDCIQYDK